LTSESHGGEDVPVFAQGPWSHLFIGTMEQHTIAHKMAYAACVGAYKNRNGCQSIIISTVAPKSHGINLFYRFQFIKLIIIFLFIFILL
jgi:hypothetical protein